MDEKIGPTEQYILEQAIQVLEENEVIKNLREGEKLLNFNLKTRSISVPKRTENFLFYSFNVLFSPPFLRVFNDFIVYPSPDPQV